MNPRTRRPFRRHAALIALIGFAANALALTPNEWRFRQPLDVPAASLVRIDLPPATLDAARPALEDLRLIDSAGQEVAFLIEQPAPQPAAQRRPQSFRASLEPAATVLAIETGIDTPIAGIALESPSGAFAKIARIEGSNDEVTWTLLVAARPILRLPNGVAQLDAEFPPGVWKSLRVTLDDHRSLPAPFTGALLLGERVEAPTVAANATIRSRDESPGVTRIAVDLGAANLRVARITLETSDRLFTRAVTIAVPEVSEDGVREQPIADGTAHRIAVDDNIAEQLDVRIERQVASRELLVLIRNQDSPPLAITGVRATLRPARMIFLAREPGTFQLLTGNTRCASPRYDLAPLAGRLKNASAITATVSALMPNPDFQSPETLPGLGGSAAVLDVSAWKFRRPLVIGTSGVMQLELDLDVLAHAARGFGDLRVMRGGRQIPYLVNARRSSARSPCKPLRQTIRNVRAYRAGRSRCRKRGCRSRASSARRPHRFSSANCGCRRKCPTSVAENTRANSAARTGSTRPITPRAKSPSNSRSRPQRTRSSSKPTTPTIRRSTSRVRAPSTP